MSMRLFAAAALAAASSTVQALTVPVTNPFVNGTFNGGLSGWDTTGTVNTRMNTDPINNGGGGPEDHREVFDNGSNPYFNSRFAVLGDDADIICCPSNAPHSGIHTLSQTFTLPATLPEGDVVSYSLTLEFQTAFDGNGFIGPLHDSFEATLTPFGSPLLFSQTLNDPGAQLNNNVFNQLLTLAPGTYTLTFTLTETFDDSLPVPEENQPSSAAGVDNISLEGTVEVNPVPLPASLWLLGGAVGGLGFAARRHGI